MIHTHVHTKYSLRDSIIDYDDLINRLKSINQNAIAITDHGNIHASVSIYKRLKKENIKYIHGCEMYICDDTNIKDQNNKYYHLVLLCKNETGRINLNKLISISNLSENFYSKPRIDFEKLKQHKDGLLVLSACLAGEISKFLLIDDYEKAKEIALKYKNEFGNDYYLEIQARNDNKQIEINKKIIALAKELDISIVVTTDAHFVTKEDKKYHDVYSFNSSYKEEGEGYIDCYIQSEEEIRNNLAYLDAEIISQAINNTHEIANKCNVELPLSAPIIPHIDVPSQYSNEKEWVMDLCQKGFEERGINKLPEKERKVYYDRYQYELNAVEEMGFLGYYLLVYTYANKVKRRGIARGSGGGSLLCYLMNITDIDPIEHKLYFERFIDVGALDALREGKITRKELKVPDVDLDFGTHDREKIIQFLINKYGQQHVACIGRFNYNKSRGTLTDIGRALGIEFNEVKEITKSLEDYELNDVLDLIEINKNNPNKPDIVKKFEKYIEKYPELFAISKKLIGLPISFGLHPCFTEDTMVLTDKGYKYIKDINIKDKVLTHTNTFQEVQKTMQSISNDVYTVDIMGIPQFKVTGNHPIYVRKKTYVGRKRKYSDPHWINVSQLTSDYLVGMAINQNNDIPVCGKLPTSNENFWWIIGRYIGDGWYEDVKHRNEKRLIICCSKYNNELETITKRIDGIFDYRYVEENTTYKIFIKDLECFEYVKQFGKYAHHKRLTSDILNLPKHLLKQFLEGYLSADGSYRKKEKVWGFKTTSKELGLGIAHCIAKVYNRHAWCAYVPPKKEKIEDREINSREKWSFEFTLDKRKKDNAFFDQGYIWLPFRKKKKLKDEYVVYNLTVANDNSYTANNIIAHNCGRVIVMQDLDYYTASCYHENGERYLQGDMHDIEDLGIVKIDALGLRTVDVIYDTLELISKDYEYINPKKLDFSDEKVLDIFKNGDTVGIFQFESYGMQATLRDMQPTGIEDLSVANALYRPGAMAYIKNYCNRKHGKEEITYLHKDLMPILSNTYGIMVFQEQLIEIGRLANLRNPDKLRKATGKKDEKLLIEVHEELKQNLLNKGWTEEQFNQLWSDMLQFAKYAFNKSHSSAYAIIAFITAKLKAYHPLEFYVSLMNSYIEDSSQYIKNNATIIYEDIINHGYVMNKFDFRQNHKKCNIYNGKINYAIPLIKHCNRQIAEELYEIRNNQYNNFIELLYDINQKTSINSVQLDILVRLGFFNEFGNSRLLNGLVEYFNFFKQGSAKQISVDKIKDNQILDNIIKRHSRLSPSGKTYMDLNVKAILNDIEEWMKCNNVRDYPIKEKINTQKEYLGFVNLTTGKEEDKRKLLVLDVKPLVSQKYNKIWAYAIDEISIGSGKKNRLTIWSNKYEKKPLQVNDILYAYKVEKNDKGYWYLQDYDIINSEFL